MDELKEKTYFFEKYIPNCLNLSHLPWFNGRKQTTILQQYTSLYQKQFGEIEKRMLYAI